MGALFERRPENAIPRHVRTMLQMLLDNQPEFAGRTYPGMPDEMLGPHSASFVMEYHGQALVVTVTDVDSVALAREDESDMPEFVEAQLYRMWENGPTDEPVVQPPLWYEED